MGLACDLPTFHVDLLFQSQFSSFGAVVSSQITASKFYPNPRVNLGRQNYRKRHGFKAERALMHQLSCQATKTLHDIGRDSSPAVHQQYF